MSIVIDGKELELDQKELLERILVELMIANKYNVLGHDEIIGEESIHEDRRR